MLWEALLQITMNGKLKIILAYHSWLFATVPVIATQDTTTISYARRL